MFTSDIGIAIYSAFLRVYICRFCYQISTRCLWLVFRVLCDVHNVHTTVVQRQLQQHVRQCVNAGYAHGANGTVLQNNLIVIDETCGTVHLTRQST